MKRLKSFILLLLLITAPLMLTACGGDDKDQDIVSAVSHDDGMAAFIDANIFNHWQAFKQTSSVHYLEHELGYGPGGQYYINGELHFGPGGIEEIITTEVYGQKDNQKHVSFKERSYPNGERENITEKYVVSDGMFYSNHSQNNLVYCTSNPGSGWYESLTYQRYIPLTVLYDYEFDAWYPNATFTKTAKVKNNMLTGEYIISFTSAGNNYFESRQTSEKEQKMYFNSQNKAVKWEYTSKTYFDGVFLATSYGYYEEITSPISLPEWFNPNDYRNLDLE